MRGPVKILVLSGLQIHPPESGGMLRTASLVSALVGRGHEVTLYSMVGRKKDYLAGKPSGFEEIRPGLREYVDRGRAWAALQFASYRLGLPPLWITSALKMHTPRMMRQLMDEADAIIVDFPFLYPAGRKAGRPVALNTHNVEADLWPSGWVRRRVAAIETQAVRSVDRVFCCSGGDLRHFAAQAAAAPTALVPNGIDASRFAQVRDGRETLRTQLGYREQDRVLFFAASSFGPNVEALGWLEKFVTEHAQLLADHNLHFLVVGSVSKRPFEKPHLKVLGMVDKVEPYFAAADIGFNCVFRGSGTNLKMAEFMTAGLPILTSDVGLRGYELTAGEDCIVFSRETLADILADRTLLGDATALAAMAGRAYEKNKRQIDMDWCIGPVLQWLQEAGA